MFAQRLLLPPALRWSVLLLLSAAFAWALTVIHFPAAVLLACMVTAIALSVQRIGLGVPAPLFALAQGVLGCLMAASLQPAALSKIASDWPVFLGATVLIVAASAGLGWLLMRRKILPGTTAIWGLAPGAASAMVLMAEDYAADVRLVAFMQYLRVAVVTATATLVAHFWASGPAPVAAHVSWFAMIEPSHLLATLTLAFGVSSLARWLQIPGGPMVVPLALGVLLQAMGLLVIELPPALLAAAFAVIGWSVGLRFTPAILQHAMRALPAVLGSIFALIGVGVLIGVGLHQLTGHDPLTAYLASSPGGADSVVIIAATSAVDAGFVMTMQLSRFLMVLLLGPRVSRLVAARSKTH